MIYMASPYTHSDPFIREVRYLQAMRAVKDLLSRERWVYSPIVHCHELSKFFSMPFNVEFWQRYNYEMLSICDRLLILRLEGWEASTGVQVEIRWAEERKMPVEYTE